MCEIMRECANEKQRKRQAEQGRGTARGRDELRESDFACLGSFLSDVQWRSSMDGCVREWIRDRIKEQAVD